jgi:hypothetical protein
MSAKSIVAGQSVKIIGRRRKVLAVVADRFWVHMLVKVNKEYRVVHYPVSYTFA